MRTLAILGTIAIVVVITWRRAPVQTIQQLVGEEQAKLLRLLAAPRSPEPFAPLMQHWRRSCRVVEMMHLAGNKPRVS